MCVCRPHLSIEGGGRLLQRAIKGLAPKQLSSDRQRRSGREDRGQRGRREGGVGKKRKIRGTHSEWVVGDVGAQCSCSTN